MLPATGEGKQGFFLLTLGSMTQCSLGCLSMVFACLALYLVYMCVVKTCNFQCCMLVFHWELHIGQELFWGAAGWTEDT